MPTNADLIGRPREEIRSLLEENERLRDTVKRWEAEDIKQAVCCNENESRIEAALALHQPWVSSTGKKFCKACSSGYYKIEHPCPTVKALKGEGETDD